MFIPICQFEGAWGPRLRAWKWPGWDCIQPIGPWSLTGLPVQAAWVNQRGPLSEAQMPEIPLHPCPGLQATLLRVLEPPRSPPTVQFGGRASGSPAQPPLVAQESTDFPGPTHPGREDGKQGFKNAALGIQRPVDRPLACRLPYETPTRRSLSPSSARVLSLCAHRPCSTLLPAPTLLLSSRHLLLLS